jgi:hypothetical protein
MHQVRIKFSEAFADQLAMTRAGGSIVFPKGRPPMFSFPSNMHYQQYLTYLRQQKENRCANSGDQNLTKKY